MVNRIKLGVLMVLAALVLSGCGFKLRGPSELAFKTMNLVAGDSSALTQEFKRVLRANGIAVVPDAKQAEVQLTVLGEARQRNILSFTSAGRAREVQLRYILSFQLKDAKGQFMIVPSEIALQRDITYSDDQVLAKESEEQLLYRDMQSDVVQQLMRRLSVVKANKPAEG